MTAALPVEIVDIIFEYVPSIGLHVSRDYDKMSTVGDHYMTIKNLLVNEYRRRVTIGTRDDAIREYVDETIKITYYGDENDEDVEDHNNYSGTVIKHIQKIIKELDIFSVKYICDLLDNSREPFIERMPYFGRNNLVEAYIKYMHFTYKDTEVFSYDDVTSDNDSIPYIDDNNEEVMKKMMPYNGYLVDLLYGQTRMSISMKKMITKSLYSYSRFIKLRPKDIYKKGILKRIGL